MSQTKAELIDGKGDVVFDTDTLAVDATNNRVGIGEAAPGTQVEVNGAEPYITIKNSTQEDTDGGRESRIIFEGEQSGGEISTLAQIEVSHDGAVDDEKGKIVISTNDGTDGTAPTERMRIRSDGNVSITDGNLIVASGHGIDFSATADSSGTMTSELFDDYEEGTFTPVYEGSVTAGTYTYGAQVGRYTKIGRVVNVTLVLTNISHAVGQNGSGTLLITGFPFVSSSTASINFTGSTRTDRVTFGANTNYVVPTMSQSQTRIGLVQVTSGAGDISTGVDDIANGQADIFATITYIVD